MVTKNVPTVYIHGSKLQRKTASNPALRPVLAAYVKWKTQSLEVAGRDDKDIAELVSLLNAYKDAVEPLLDARKNSGQEVLQASILEEFFEFLFCKISEQIGHEIVRKPAAGFIDLVINPRSLQALLSEPEHTIRQKDHDFVLGGNVLLSIKALGGPDGTSMELVVPMVAIECKRYLEKNMLDECAGTAERVKRATPYCRYYVVAEYLKMDDASPEISLIDEIYVLRKQKNSERLAQDFVPRPIASDLVIELYRACVDHLQKVWWDPSSALVTGKVFNYR